MNQYLRPLWKVIRRVRPVGLLLVGLSCENRPAEPTTETVSLQVPSRSDCNAEIEISRDYTPTFVHSHLPYSSGQLAVERGHHVSFSVSLDLSCPLPPEELVCVLEVNGRAFRRVPGWVRHAQFGVVQGIVCFVDYDAGGENRQVDETLTPEQAASAREMRSRWAEAQALEAQRAARAEAATHDAGRVRGRPR
jgi:hypothetical protein